MTIETVRVEQRSTTNLPAKIFNHESGDFRESFNHLPFAVSHNLGNHPLFELPRLRRLAETLWAKTGKIVFFTDTPKLEQGWNRSRQRSASLAQAFSRLEETSSWVLLKSVQDDPEYRALLEQSIDELEELTATALRKQITWADAYVFIASPNTRTPYHIDHESNFLMQIHGEKEVNLFDPNDRTVLTDKEIEEYYIGDLSGARYRPEIQSKARVFKLTPGTGVHHPVRAPHWVQNGNSYSISLSVLFCLREFDLQAKVYQANHFIRKLNLAPTPPGKSLIKDKAKSLLLSDLGHKPKTKSEVIRYAVTRYDAPVNLARKFARSFGLKSDSPQQATTAAEVK